MALDDSQSQAVTHREGPMMVLAGPGSGKTTVITHRTRHLIDSCGVDPSGILVITFTKAAAIEMQERFERLMEGRRTYVTFGTFHSVFFRILKYAYRYDASHIVREEQKTGYMKDLMEQYQIDTEDEPEFISSVLSEISLVKGDMIDVNHYYARNCPEEVFKNLYRGYERRLRKDGLIDFDDMLVMCYELLSQRPDILLAWQNKYRYILIDEFQDINRIQYQIIRMLAKPEDNLFIVGDDDQSIYRFRGARPEIMLGFEKDYPQARRVLLGINYRSTKEIVDAAGRLIQKNQTRFAKEIKSFRQGGCPVIITAWANPQEETEGIISELREYQRMGTGLSDIAVLFRTSSNPRLLIERLMEYNLPFRMRDMIPNLYEHWIVKDVLTYIKIALGDLSRGSVLRIINRPKRYISRDALEDPVVVWQRVKNFYQDKDWMEERIERLEYDLHMIRQMAPWAAVNYIRKAVDYDGYLKEYAQFRRMNPEELSEILDQLMESASSYKTYGEWFHHMEEYGKKLRQQALSREAVPEGISLMTMHSAKGLEYRIVYILDANERITPHQKAVLSIDLEEERRMFYVAMTRAKDRLHVCYVKERYHKKQEVSRFVEEFREPAKS